MRFWRATAQLKPRATPPRARAIVIPTLARSLVSLAGFLTKKGLNYLLPNFDKYDFHAAMTIEGRSDDELPEQTLCATRIRGVDIVKLAVSHDFGEL